MMKIPADNLHIKISLILIFVILQFSGAYSQDQKELSNSNKNREDYEALMRINIDSVRKTLPISDLPNDSLLVTLYDEYKSQYLDLGSKREWQEALAVALACETIFSRYLPPKAETDLIYSIGYIYDKCENYLQALNYYNQSIELYKTIQKRGEIDVRNDIALTYNNIGVVHAHTGFFTKRKESYLKAKEMWESIEDVDKSYLISVYGNLLRLYLQYGDKEAAGDLITAINTNFDQWLTDDSFMKKRKEVEMEQHSQAFYQVEKHRLNILYTDLVSDKEGGLTHLDSLRAKFAKMNRKEQQRYSAYLLTSISHAAAPLVNYEDQQERKEKKRLLDLGMRESIRLGDRYNKMIFHSQLVSYFLDAEQNEEEAFSHLDQAIQIGHEMDIREFNLLNLYLKKGSMLQKAGRFSEAEELVLKSMSILLDHPVDDPTLVSINDFAERNDIYYINAMKQVAGIYRDEYQKSHNREHARLSYHFYDLTANLFQVYYQKGAYNPSLNRTNAAINEGLLSLHLELGEADATSLIDLMENNHSQHLAKEFEAKHFRFLHVPDSLFTLRNMLLAKIASYNQKDELGSEYYDALQVRLKEVEASITALDANYLTFFDSRFEINEVQSRLKVGEFIIRYVSAEESIYAYLINKDSISFAVLGNKKDLLSLVDEYHLSIRNIEGNHFELAQTLYSYLIDPLDVPLEKVQKLIVIPVDKLSYIPFETLVPNGQHRPLVTNFPISYSYGLNLWLLKQVSTTNGNKQRYLAAFAPKYSNSYMNSFAEDYPPSRSRLYDIAGATREAAELTKYFEGNFYQGEEATKFGFLQRATDYRIYHLAMHALLDESNHLNSSLVFQDGEPLYCHELYGMHFPADLVVMSACNTGVGELENGEGLMSLSRALTYAGVRSSVYSLWEVPDEETAEIMLSFYKHLKKGYSKEEALAIAKQHFLVNNPMKSHPFFWAGFVVNGNTEPLTKTIFNSSYLLLLGIFVIVVSIVLFSRRKKRREIPR
ncbi:MAG TPA: CHAT domain-containing tetratricopeptide repeat protein [Fermentimonas sp.]|nr:CHAT domain-containing tetratricopeptide repeat protein [Fermentimonas sp.]